MADIDLVGTVKNIVEGTAIFLLGGGSFVVGVKVLEALIALL